jgi:CheY-like chemotaxis protein
MDKLFENYSQIGTQANRLTEGTGLGLSICKSLVELMHGSISVQSEFGVGSVFLAKFFQDIVDITPIGEDIAQKLENHQLMRLRSEASLVRPLMPEGRVLVVDDVQTNLDVAKGLLGRYGLQVDCANSGRQALALMQELETHYDFVFMDHMMPELDGLETLQLIRELGDEGRNLPVIMLTANVVNERRKMFLKCGAQDMLAKPIDLAALDKVLKTWIPKEKQRVREEAEPEGSVGTFLDDLQISGLDERVGLRNMGGAAALYKDVLLSFCADAEEKKADILAASLSTNLENFTTLVHGMKGAALSVGALAVGEAARRLELAGEKQDAVFIQTETENFLAQVGALSQRIRSALETKTTDMEDGDALAKIHLGRLQAALTSFDIDEVNTLLKESLTRTWGEHIYKLITEIDKHVLLFEYDEAVAKLAEFLGAQK